MKTYFVDKTIVQHYAIRAKDADEAHEIVWADRDDQWDAAEVFSTELVDEDIWDDEDEEEDQ